jgi:uncharacterized coiled-coil protein SlyX
MADERKPMANIPPFGLRMQPDLKARVEQAAAENNRSLNSEIVDRLERSFEYANLPTAYERAEARLAEQEKTVGDLRRQIEVLETNLADMKAGRDVDLSNEAVQEAMIERMREMMGSVVQDMREEHRITSGMPLLLTWFDENPEERAKYDALPEDAQDEFVVAKTHELWVEHINARREAAGKRQAAKPKSGRRVRLDK